MYHGESMYVSGISDPVDSHSGNTDSDPAFASDTDTDQAAVNTRCPWLHVAYSRNYGASGDSSVGDTDTSHTDSAPAH